MIFFCVFVSWMKNYHFLLLSSAECMDSGSRECIESVECTDQNKCELNKSENIETNILCENGFKEINGKCIGKFCSRFISFIRISK